MKTKHITVGMSAVFILASSALVFAAEATSKAETPKVKAEESLKKPLGKLTCEEFISFEDVIKPQYVIAAAAHTKGGKAKDTVIEVVDTDTLVPVLIEECQKAPTESFWKKLKLKLDKIKSKL
jgi:acid stress chaperone HdeA